jgi:starvation-inducible outer membrane lipoprotein
MRGAEMRPTLRQGGFMKRFLIIALAALLLLSGCVTAPN